MPSDQQRVGFGTVAWALIKRNALIAATYRLVYITSYERVLLIKAAVCFVGADGGLVRAARPNLPRAVGAGPGRLSGPVRP